MPAEPADAPERPAVIDLADLVADAARERPDHLALVEAGGRSLTWAELDAEVARVATGLGAAGLVAGHRVVLALGNRLEFVTAYLGVLRARLVAVPVNPRSTAGELARVTGDCGARLVVADAGSVVAVREGVALLGRALDGEYDGELGVADADLLSRAVRPRVVVVGVPAEAGERPWEELRAVTARPVPPLQDPDRLAVLLYTSGTSGRPRGAMLSHRALLANIEQVAAVEPAMIHGDDVVLGVLPLFHVYGLNAVLGGVLRHRAKLVVAEHFDPQGTLDLIEDEACSVVPLAPPVFVQWRDEEHLAERLGPVRLVLSGSAPLAPELVEDFTARTGLAVHQGYGLTEAAPVVTSTLCSLGRGSLGRGSLGRGSGELRPGSVGAALPGIRLRLVDETGGPAAGEDPGEIEVAGANLFSGYWPDGADGPDPDGWWATGDVGFLDATGDLYLVDRVKELVIVSGFNVYPSEVEDVVREVPGVDAVAVIGVADAGTGEAVVAYVRAPGADPDAVEDAVRRHCAQRLARFKQPVRVEVVDRLPTTVTGKVQKGRLRGLERRRAQGLLE